MEGNPSSMFIGFSKVHGNKKHKLTRLSVDIILKSSLPRLENLKVSVFSKSLSVAILLPNSISGNCCFC